MITDYYTSQTEKLLKKYDKWAKRAKKIMTPYYGEMSDEILDETRVGFEQIIPELPFIGKKNIFNPVIIINGWIVAYYRVMKNKGRPVEEIIKVLYETVDDEMQSYPGFIMRLAGRMTGTRLVNRKFKKFAKETHKRTYPEDFVATYLDGKDKDFDWGWDFKECAVTKFYKAQNTEELAPYCYFFDYAQSKAMNLGMEHVTTIGLGNPICRIQINRGKETPLKDQLRQVIDLQINLP